MSGRHRSRPDRSRLGIPRPDHPMLARMVDVLDFVAVGVAALALTGSIHLYSLADKELTGWFDVHSGVEHRLPQQQ